MRRDSELLDSVEHASMIEGPLSGGKDELLDVELETLKRMEQLSAGKYRDGKYAESLELQQVVYNTRVRLNGVDDPATLLTLGNMAATYGRLNMIKKAEETYRVVLSAQQDKLGPDHSDTLMTANHLGVVLKHVRSKMEESEEMMRRAFEGLSKLLETHNAAMALHLNQQSITQLSNPSEHAYSTNNSRSNSPAVATPDYDHEKSLVCTVQSDSRNAWDPDSSLDMSRLSVLSEGGSRDPFITRARQLNICVAEASYNLGVLYVQQGKRKAAYFYFQRAREGLGAVLGQNHAHTLDAMEWEMKCSSALSHDDNSRTADNIGGVSDIVSVVAGEQSVDRSTSDVTATAAAASTDYPSEEHSNKPISTPPSSPSPQSAAAGPVMLNGRAGAEAESESKSESSAVTGAVVESQSDTIVAGVTPETADGSRHVTERVWQPSKQQIAAEPMYISRRDWKRNSKMCGLCAVGYGLFRREHHCRVCSNSVCFYCCRGKTMVLEYSKSRRVKACNRCIQQGF